MIEVQLLRERFLVNGQEVRISENMGLIKYGK